MISLFKKLLVAIIMIALLIAGVEYFIGWRLIAGCSLIGVVLYCIYKATPTEDPEQEVIITVRQVR